MKRWILISLLLACTLLSCHAKSDRMLHYWDRFPYGDTAMFRDTLWMQQTLVHWMQQVEQQPDSLAPEYARAAITAGHGHPDGQKAMFLWMESMLNDPNSPFRNEEMFIPVLEAMTQDSLIADIDKTRPRFLLQKANKNRPGTKAANIRFLATNEKNNKDGKHRRLHDVKAERIILYFFNPDCHDCKRVGDILKEDSLLQQQQQQGTLQIVAIYPDKNLTAWNKAKGTYPTSWIVGRIDDQKEKEKYNLPAIPSLYLLDRHHTVLLKDVSIETLISNRSSHLQ